jgi:hypothetical protein
MLFQRLQEATPSSDLENAQTLASAGRAVYQKALNERLPLAHIAEQSGRPQYWFANNILQIVHAYGSPPAKAEHVLLTREITNSLKLSDDMLALTEPKKSDPSYIDLRVTGDQLERYMTWARTVY